MIAITRRELPVSLYVLLMSDEKVMTFIRTVDPRS